MPEFDNSVEPNLEPAQSTVISHRDYNDNPASQDHKEIEPEEPEVQPEELKKPESRMDVIKRAVEEAEGKGKDAKESKVEAKAENPEKQELKEAKPVEESKAEKKAEDGSEPVAEKQAKPSEGRRIIEAPARFLPRAKELWNNVPHPVREEFERISKENEAEISQYREAKQFRDDLKEYEDLGRLHGVSVKQALQNYTDIERKFTQSPPEGFRQLLSNLNMSPTQAIGHLMAAYNVKPEQVAAHMQQQPHEYTALARQQNQQPQQQPQPMRQTDPQVQQLEQRLQAMENERVVNSVIAPFAEEYPEFYQHEEQIAEILKSGIIEKIHGKDISPRDKLEVALRMVAPNARRSSGNPVLQSEPEPTPAVDLRGNQTKSVRGNPNPGLDNSGRRNAKLSRTDALTLAMDELGIR